ncbi:hypothetical protein HZA55_07420 [Candidatus Poribacteria bacterium]|nr:hypothetical protein [Candidatus Poribacteria bacterium]
MNNHLKNKNIIVFIIICLLLCLSSNLYSESNIEKDIIGTWKLEENVQNAIVITNLIFDKNNTFKYIIEETVGKDKATSKSEGIYNFSGNVITMEYKSFDGNPLPEKDKQKQSFDIYIFNNMLAFPVYEEVKDNNNNVKNIYKTDFRAYSSSSKYEFENEEKISEIITFKKDGTVHLLSTIKRNQKAAGKNKNEENMIEKNGTFKEENKLFSITFNKSSIDSKTSPENPEIKNMKIIQDGKFALINPFKKF